ncbi:triose-phosphate isomerase [bacterium K02(2017)]|nr:triose-phosphate isomerase [bacterium K02(2017)]
MQREPLVVANWKMNNGLEDTIKFITEFGRSTLPESVEVVICPPFTSIYTLSVALGEDSELKIGAQNCYHEKSGAYTGEISADFIREIPCEYVIVGHSERRQIFKEDNELLQKKLIRVIEAKLTPIYCVGETLDEREADKTFDVIKDQLEQALLKFDKDQISEMVFAYEPVWAIGTGKTATPELAQEVHAFIRKWIGKNFGTSYAELPRILYGGSVKPENASALMAQPDIDGALVGGASLKPEDFVEIISACR